MIDGVDLGDLAACIYREELTLWLTLGQFVTFQITWLKHECDMWSLSKNCGGLHISCLLKIYENFLLSLNLVVVLNHRYEKFCFCFFITVTKFTLDWQVVLLLFFYIAVVHLILVPRKYCPMPKRWGHEFLPVVCCLFISFLWTRFRIYIHLSLSNILCIWYRVTLLDLYRENYLGCSCSIWIRVKAESA